jgi:hypothetical protein
MVGATQQRFVAHVERTMPRRIDPHRPRKPAAVSAGQEYRPFARQREYPRHRQCSWRLAATANRQIPRTYDRHAGAPPGRPETPSGNGAIGHRRRRQQRGSDAGVTPPK